MPQETLPVRQKRIYIPELLFRVLVLLLAVTAIALSLVMTVQDDREVYLPFTTQPMPEMCGIRGMLGVDCPGCGMSRAFISISNLKIDKALAFNSASLVMYLFVMIQVPWHATQIFMTLYCGGPIDTWWTLFPPVSVILWLLWCYVS